MNIEYVNAIVFMMVWLLFRFLKNDLLEKNKKIIVVSIIFLIILFAIFLPEKTMIISYIAIGLLIGEWVYLKIKNFGKKDKNNGAKEEQKTDSQLN